MSHGKKYDASGLVEAQYEPGSRGRVLKNLLGIRTRRDMARAEGAAQFNVYLDFVLDIDKHHRFTAEDICTMHRKWLGSILSMGRPLSAGQPDQRPVSLRHSRAHSPDDEGVGAGSVACLYPLCLRNGSRRRSGGSSRPYRTGADSPLSGRQWARGPFPGSSHGDAGGLSPAGLWRSSGKTAAGILCRCAGWLGEKLRADGDNLSGGAQADFAIPWAAFRGVILVLGCCKSASVRWMPSIAVEVRTVLWMSARRLAGFRRNGLVWTSGFFTMLLL